MIKTKVAKAVSKAVTKDVPHPLNFCGGNFPDWLEVCLTHECNGHCAWCIERKGWIPKTAVSWQEIAKKAIGTGKKNIILLGGEPTLYPDLQKLIKEIWNAGRKVWVTTNGSMLKPSWVDENLMHIEGVNISVHHYFRSSNKEITGLDIRREDLSDSIKVLKDMSANIRMNCNCIKGYIDSYDQIKNYIVFAKEIGADKVRFAELKDDEKNFVDLAKILNYEYGLNDDPFKCGCQSDAVIDGMPVNFRQMCGLQTSRRMKPENPDQAIKEVLYYDGKIYNGWQIDKTKVKDKIMTDKRLVDILEDVRSGSMSVVEAALEIQRDMLTKPKDDEDKDPLAELVAKMKKGTATKLKKSLADEDDDSTSSGGCVY